MNKLETKQNKKKSSLNDDFFENKKILKNKEIEKLQNMSEIETKLINKKKQLNELSINEIYQNCVIVWKDIIKDFDHSKISYNYLAEFLDINNRKFYLGILLCFIGLILYIFDTLFIN